MVRMWRKGNAPACIIGFNINWYSHYWRTIWRFLKKLKIELPYDPPIPLLGMNLKKKIKILTQKETCTPTFIAALFTTAKKWKQPKCPSTDEWIEIWHIYIYTHILPRWHSVVKNPPAYAGDIGDVGSIPGSGRFPGERNGNPLQYSCLENSMDRGA